MSSSFPSCPFLFFLFFCFLFSCLSFCLSVAVLWTLLTWDRLVNCSVLLILCLWECVFHETMANFVEKVTIQYITIYIYICMSDFLCRTSRSLSRAVGWPGLRNSGLLFQISLRRRNKKNIVKPSLYVYDGWPWLLKTTLSDRYLLESLL